MKILQLGIAVGAPSSPVENNQHWLSQGRGIEPEGSTIDFVEGLQGAGFKVENPNVIAACGCGSSFRVAEEEEVSAV